MQEITLKNKYFDGLSNSVEKVNFIFWTQSLLMNKLMKNKRGMELVTSRYSGYKISPE